MSDPRNPLNDLKQTTENVSKKTMMVLESTIQSIQDMMVHLQAFQALFSDINKQKKGPSIRGHLQATANSLDKLIGNLIQLNNQLLANKTKSAMVNDELAKKGLSTVDKQKLLKNMEDNLSELIVLQKEAQAFKQQIDTYMPLIMDMSPKNTEANALYKRANTFEQELRKQNEYAKNLRDKLKGELKQERISSEKPATADKRDARNADADQSSATYKKR